jgi:hypothetical protein
VCRAEELAYLQAIRHELAQTMEALDTAQSEADRLTVIAGGVAEMTRKWQQQQKEATAVSTAASHTSPSPQATLFSRPASPHHCQICMYNQAKERVESLSEVNGFLTAAANKGAELVTEREAALCDAAQQVRLR